MKTAFHVGEPGPGFGIAHAGSLELLLGTLHEAIITVSGSTVVPARD